jgi:hypothetical protein
VFSMECVECVLQNESAAGCSTVASRVCLPVCVCVSVSVSVCVSYVSCDFICVSVSTT